MALEETGVSFSNEGSDAFIAAFEDAGGAAGDFESAVTDAGRGIDVAGEIMTGALRAIGEAALNMAMAAGGALVDFFSDSFAGALEAEQGIARLTAQIEAQGPAAAVTADQALALADEYKHLAGGSDDAVIAAEAVLLKFNAIGSEAFPLAIEQSANLAALMGTDLASASQLLGLALDDPTSSLTRLDKATGAFTEAEKEQIKAMAEAGDVAGAQALILANLEEAIGGTAETLGATTAGQWAIFQETLADAGESIMTALLPALNGLLASLMPLVPIVEQVAAGIGAFFEMILGGGDVGTAFDNLAGAMYRAFGPEVGLIVMQIGDTLTGVYDWVVANLPLMQATFETVFAAVQGVLTTTVDWVVANWPQIQAKIEEMWAVVQPILQAAADFIIGTVIPAFAQAVDWVVANWPTIQANIEAVMTAVQAVINVVMNQVVPFVLEMFGQIKAWVDTNWPLIQATIETIINNISTSIHAVIDPLVAFWIANHETIMAVASAIWENMKLSISTAITAIGAIITITMQLITGDWTGAWTTIQTTLTTIWANMEAMAANSIAAIYAVVSDVLASLKTWWDAKWTEIQNSVTTILASILVTISTTVANIVTAFTSIDWLGVGASIIQGIQQGITNLAGSLAQSAADAAYAAYQAMLDALGIGSPSRLFAGVGKNVIESMGDSMTDATPTAMDAARTAAQLISSAYIDPFTQAMMQMAGMQDDLISQSASAGQAAGAAYIDPFTQAMMQAAAMQQSIAAPLVGYDVAPVSTTGASDVRNTTYSTTDSRSYNLNATTDRQMQTVQSEFSTMQTLAGLS